MIHSLKYILRQLPAKLQSKEGQCDSTGEVYPAKESWSNKLAAPCDKPSHKKDPKHCSAQKPSKEDSEMNWLGISGYGCEHRTAKSGPKYNVEWITEGEKCTIGEIAPVCSAYRRCDIQFFAVVGIFEGIPCKLEYQNNTDQTEAGFGNIVLNEKC